MSKIAEFYADRTVLITGATGFMGKVLLERMLCTLHDIKRIYIIMRSKKGASLQERIKNLFSQQPFTFNNIPQSQFDKVFTINGDLSKIGLDLTEESRNIIINEVSIVIHLAAATRFNLPLKDAIIQNTIATKTILELCKEVKNLVSVVHVSTAFCNVDIGECEEKVYDIDDDINRILDLVNTDDMDISEKDIIAPHPNTYTYTKRLAEIIARDAGKDLPVSIVRPSIVTPSVRKPVEGWVDNFYGPIGFLSTVGVGLVRVALADETIKPDLIPVDCAINGIIAAAWFRQQQQDNETPVLNLTLNQQKKRPWKYIFDILRDLSQKYPHKRLLWYPRGWSTTSYPIYYVVTFICQILPSIIGDALLILFQQKPFLLDAQKKIYNANKVIQYFVLRKFNFVTTKAQYLFRSLSPIDKEIFFSITDEMELGDEYTKNCYFGVQKYVFKDDGASDFRYILVKVLFVLDMLLQMFVVYGLFLFVVYLFRVFT